MYGTGHHKPNKLTFIVEPTINLFYVIKFADV